MIILNNNSNWNSVKKKTLEFQIIKYKMKNNEIKFKKKTRLKSDKKYKLFEKKTKYIILLVIIILTCKSILTCCIKRCE